MNYSADYTAMDREALMQAVQMRMSERRFTHVLGVEETAVALAKRFGGSIEKASIAALVHDYAKERTDEEFQLAIEQGPYENKTELLKYGNAIWHGLVGAYFVAQELTITDEEILDAIRLHTTGAAEMSLLAKIIYVADYIEPGRKFPGVEDARVIAFNDLDQAVAFETKHTLLHLIEGENLIYPKTLETYNRWVCGLE
ncbi:bis(5'-nucleosyl)-tetraphosphatase (symmetrical) YqeK [Enterococcus dongliensis]|uniref:bis(5'-nucleosyl)-tetraphosphatase (symmetrical) n=1 Tax=Enterococcus dongliensis TaxID=2559925 RepID=A0AAW8TI18_9ENTE|nr:bis(5'-nucleosyl)-tetraphosphatase (symmetrical) YqeK [Enterococcus dongliensis]MDT2597504.1 bis(5'-nucleosyl)-tetraphosphatase (symmetrical) YqeK [Enterococcus dongliensis]MDT2603052.1 bis(5'-nucleosyl)-tetraphosphatase (symmetrical) YqeK [Enterococcus dongliensis]MDT2633396.1 bis(5'-nucleosyl)-tetraphosphatase (symmetrical) YqeK [Enterococcus dongliensis]MDT2636747.1 bis(5'-nucleosyl)-tetraphosphatase (symmetrical) YqeK [Enterococcus dongliensis]MDT2641382.1 bis(5'-nucleosyl)-tetraphospha